VSGPSTTSTGLLRRLAGATLLLATSLLVSALLAEGALRLLAASGNRVARQVAAADPDAVKVEPFGAFGYRQRPGAVLHYGNGTSASANRLGFRGPDVTVPKPAGVYRIVLLGESSTHGWYVNDDQTIDAYLRAVLAGERPDLRVEVVDLAYDGYDSYQMWQRLAHDGVPLQPDLVVVNAGVNDVRNARYAHLHGDPDPRTLIWEPELRRQEAEIARGGPTLWTRLKHVSYLTRLPGVIRQDLTARRRGAGPAAGGHPDPGAADNFQRNIERIAAIAGRLRAPLVLSTPPSALFLPDAPSPMLRRDYWLQDRAATQRYRDTLAARLRVVAARLRAESQPAVYVAPRLPGAAFLDDVHLTPEGNRAMAEALATAIGPFLPPRR
jgi:lysophospholipase L1-like esterase